MTITYDDTDRLHAEAYKDHLRGSIITMEQVESAERTVEFLIEHPRLHNQSDWLINWDLAVLGKPYVVKSREVEGIECGTGGCFAGWHALLNGQDVLVDSASSIPFIENPNERRSLAEWAADDLGLPPFTMSTLEHMFSGSNDVTDLRRWTLAMRIRATELAAAAGLPTPEPELVS